MKPVAMSPRPLAGISMDLDNQWSYMKTHGDNGWESFPSYFDRLLPFVLDLFAQEELTVTFFIVGQDAALQKNRRSLQLITERGHEVGNHSYHHQPWLHRYEKSHIRDEIIQAEEHIIAATKQKPLGFRGPGFSWSAELIEVLIENKYLFDASTFPTYIGPLARTYYFWTSRLSDDERAERKKLFGSFREGMRPVKPYQWQTLSGETLLEIPVTTMPIFKIPFHLSYLIYLSSYSPILMRLYLQTALTLCRITRTEPSFLLHPLDFLGRDEVPELAFFPGMNMPKSIKKTLFKMVLGEIRKHFMVVSLNTYADTIKQRKSLQHYSLGS